MSGGRRRHDSGRMTGAARQTARPSGRRGRKGRQAGNGAADHSDAPPKQGVDAGVQLSCPCLEDHWIVLHLPSAAKTPADLRLYLRPFIRKIIQLSKQQRTPRSELVSVFGWCRPYRFHLLSAAIVSPLQRQNNLSRTVTDRSKLTGGIFLAIVSPKSMMPVPALSTQPHRPITALRDAGAVGLATPLPRLKTCGHHQPLSHRVDQTTKRLRPPARNPFEAMARRATDIAHHAPLGGLLLEVFRLQSVGRPRTPPARKPLKQLRRQSVHADQEQRQTLGK